MECEVGHFYDRRCCEINAIAKWVTLVTARCCGLNEIAKWVKYVIVTPLVSAKSPTGGSLFLIV